MAKLNQIIAISTGKKTQSKKVITDIYQKLQKAELLQGLTRTYRPKDEDGDKLPDERKHIQLNANTAIKEVVVNMEELFNIVATQDMANCEARATISVDGKDLMADVPVTHLLFLEKQLVDIHTFIEKLPTLDPAEQWSYSDAQDCYVSPQYESLRTKKVLKNHVKAEATDKHPAQVETYTEDIPVGTWYTVKYSGAVPVKEKNVMFERVRKLQDAVKIAREQANSIDVNSKKIAGPMLAYIFDKL